MSAEWMLLSFYAMVMSGFCIEAIRLDKMRPSDAPPPYIRIAAVLTVSFVWPILFAAWAVKAAVENSRNLR